MLDDGAQDIKEWQLIQEKEFPKGTWLTVTWLFGECFTYRLIQAMLSQSTHWNQLDPFAQQKARTLKASQDSIVALGKRYVEDILGKKSGKSEAEVFREIALICLWGNRADLSLLVHLDLAKAGEGATFQLKSDEHAEIPILANDLDRVWKYVCTLLSSRIDIVLDNAGKEGTEHGEMWVVLHSLGMGEEDSNLLHPPFFLLLLNHMTTHLPLRI